MTRELYLFAYQCNSNVISNTWEDIGKAVPDKYEPSLVPTGMWSADNGTNTGYTVNSKTNLASLQFRNSFYWGPKQLDGVLTNLGLREFSFPGKPSQRDTFDPLNAHPLKAEHYHWGRMRHWLSQAETPSSQVANVVVATMTDRISLERAPSPVLDQLTEGPLTWFDYKGKATGNAYLLSPSGDPRVSQIARVLPDGTTQRYAVDYGTSAFPLFTTNTFTKPDGAVGIRTNQYVYDANGIDLREIRDPTADGAGVITVAGFVYNANHQVIRYTNAANEVTQMQYDSNTGKLTSLLSSSGLTINLQYYPENVQSYFDQINGWNINDAGYHNACHLKSIEWVETGRMLEFTYTNALVYTVKDERGLWVTNEWDRLNRLTRISFPDGTSISNRYDKLDLVQVINRLGHTNLFQYNRLQQLTAYTNALENVTRFTYCDCGVLESVLNALDQITTFNYDNQGRLVKTRFPDTSFVNYDYDFVGRLTNVVNADKSFSLGYNNQGLLTTATNAFGQAVRLAFDARDRATNIVLSSGLSITNTYDNLNRLVFRKLNDGTQEGFGYSSNGLVAYTNQLDKKTYFTNDAAGRLIAVFNANQEVVKFAYDSLGNLTNLIDAATHERKWKYDLYGRVTNKVDGVGATVFTNAYDANGRLIKHWTPAKGTIQYQYDAAGNLLHIDYPSSKDVTFAYDALNRLTNMVDAVGTTRFSYKNFGALESEDGPWANDTLTYSYVNRLLDTLSLAQSSGSSWSQSFGYDDALRFRTITSPVGQFTYDYVNASAVIKKLTLPGGAYITNLFDGMGRLTNTVLKTSGDVVRNSHAYTYDAASQITNQIRWDGSKMAYTYDPIGQLVSAVGTNANDTPRLLEKLGWSYDAVGNVTNRTNNALIHSFVPNNSDRLASGSRTGTLTVSGMTEGGATSVTVDGNPAELYADGTFAKQGITISTGNNTFDAVAQGPNGPVSHSVTVNLPENLTFQHDGNGNLTGDGLRVFTYDDENQLTSVTVANKWKTDFKYDGLGRRRVTRDWAWQNNSWVLTNDAYYVYAGSLVMQERDALNAPKVTYTRGLDLSGSLSGAGGIGGLLARTDGMGTAYYHADAGGNITAMVNSQGAVVARYLYDPFGNLLGKSGVLAEANLYRFSSKELHANSGLYYYGFRFFDRGLQRWLTEDPLGEAGGINLYRFVGNSPMNGVDPFGLDYRYADGGSIFGWSVPTGFASYVGGDTAFERTVANINNLGSFAVNVGGHVLTGIPGFLDWASDQSGVSRLSGGRPSELMEAVNPSLASGAIWLRSLRRCPVAAKTPVDKSWKALIEGTAQKTDTPGHQFRTYREAIGMAKSSEYSRIRLNRAYSTTDEVQSLSRRRPDIIGIRRDGRVDAVEVPSRTDDPRALFNRNWDVFEDLSDLRRGEVIIAPIR